jgi:TDG/mug DNA glycosylase family protein
LGNTNIVSRPSRNGAELKQSELDAGVAILQEKVSKFKPEAVCIVGKSIWESIWRVRHKTKLGKDFKYGWQGEEENMGVIEGWKGAKVFVATTTSALAAGMSYAEKEKIWSGLGEWVKQRRVDRAGDEIAATNEV